MTLRFTLIMSIVRNMLLLTTILAQLVHCDGHTNFSFLQDAKSWEEIEAGFAAQVSNEVEPILSSVPLASPPGPLSPDDLLLVNNQSSQVAIDEENTKKANLVRFFLYTDYQSQFSPDELVYENYKSVVQSKFNKNLAVKFFIHGFGHHYNCTYPQRIKDIYIYEQVRKSSKTPKKGLNMILVDWGALSMDSTKADPVAALSNYKMAVDHVKIVGKRVGQMISFFLQNRATTLNKTHIVGFSLGSHVAGHAGQHVYRTWFDKIGRITGLDPARPLFTTGSVGRHLSNSDAHFVDFVHTDMGQCGTTKSLGHANFFLNGGIPPQPGCLQNVLKSNFFSMVPLMLSGSCSHNRATQFYGQSILSEIEAKKCFSYVAYETGICFLQSTTDFGDNCQPEARGNYYLNLKPMGNDVFTNYTC